jgi:rhomboid protease GluP
MIKFKPSNYATYGIIAVNTIIFLIILVKYRFGFLPDQSFETLKFGASAPGISFGGEWWRTITYMFVHFSLLQLIINMGALFFIGSLLETILGRWRFILAYIVAGVTAALVSAVWYKNEDIILAGSSGAIAGLIGICLSLFLFKIISGEKKIRLLPALLIFAGFNITYGSISDSGVDNAAHAGGFIMGIAIGAVYFFTFKNPSLTKTVTIVSSLVIVVIAAFVMLLWSQHTGKMGIDYDAERFYSKSDRRMREDDDKFKRAVQHFDILQEIALEAMYVPDSTNPERYLKDLSDVALNDWVECVNLMDEASSLSLTEEMETLRKKLHVYSNHRIEETLLLIKSKKENTDRYNHSIDSIQQLIRRITDGKKRERYEEPAPKEYEDYEEEVIPVMPEEYERPYKGNL